MSPFVIVVAALQLSGSGAINIVAQPSENLEECRAIGEGVIKSATAQPGSYSSYVCLDVTGKAGALGVVAYVRPSDGKINIREGIKPTLGECKAMGMAAAATKVVPGAMAWVCYDLQSFEQ